MAKHLIMFLVSVDTKEYQDTPKRTWLAVKCVRLDRLGAGRLEQSNINNYGEVCFVIDRSSEQIS